MSITNEFFLEFRRYAVFMYLMQYKTFSNVLLIRFLFTKFDYIHQFIKFSYLYYWLLRKQSQITLILKWFYVILFGVYYSDKKNYQYIYHLKWFLQSTLFSLSGVCMASINVFAFYSLRWSSVELRPLIIAYFVLTVVTVVISVIFSALVKYHSSSLICPVSVCRKYSGHYRKLIDYNQVRLLYQCFLRKIFNHKLSSFSRNDVIVADVAFT